MRWIEKIEGAHELQLNALYDKEWWTRGRTPEDVSRMLSGSDLLIGCCDHNDDLVGFARILIDKIYKAVIFDVIVAESVRGQGIGVALINRIKQHPDLQNVQSFELYCPETIAPFYRKLGFETSDSKLLRAKQI